MSNQDDRGFAPDDYEDPGPFTATRCPCGMKGCHAWHVDVKFSKRQAQAVAKLLNEMAQAKAEAG